MATDFEAASRDPPAAPPTSTPTRGRGRGGRGRGRGRGGGRGASQAAAVIKNTPTTRGGRGGVRRGRAKTFTDSRVQAAYERQRDLKSLYQTITAALKPALQELAERNVDEVLAHPDNYRNVDEYLPVISQLQQRLKETLSMTEKRHELDLGVAEKRFDGDQFMINQQFENAVADLFEQFYETQSNRVRILASLHGKGLPVDVRDDQYEYKTIKDDVLDKDFGIYEPYINGHLVPYPSRVPGTDMWQKARDNDAASAAIAAANAVTTATTTVPTRGRGRGRGGIKRKPAGDPDGIPTPKRSTRNTVEDLSMAPAPAKGLLASAAEADLPAETPREEVSPYGTPEPSDFMAQLHARMGDKPMEPRDKSPPLPRNINDPDEYGVRLYNAKASLREKGANSRLLAPPAFEWDDVEIGFRDSTNDQNKGHSVTKRGKYLNTPNSNGMHYDHWCLGYDYSKTKGGDFDQDLVKKHGVHPTYGIFLPESMNEKEGPYPFHMPGKPVVYIAQPSGRAVHASRSFVSTVNHNRTKDDPYRAKLGASLRRFCKVDSIDVAEVAVNDYLPTQDELKARSLGHAQDEYLKRSAAIGSEDDSEGKSESAFEPTAEEPQASMQSADPCQRVLALLAASEFVEAQAAAATEPLTPAPSKKQQKYDAIRDIFVTESEPEPQPQPEVQQAHGTARNEDVSLLDMLASCAESEARKVAEQPPQQDRRVTGYSVAEPVQSTRPAQPPHFAKFAQPAPEAAESMAFKRELDGDYPVSNERETSYDRSSVAFAPPRPPEAQYPVSSEREAPYVPPTPTQTYRDPRMSIESHTAPTPAPHANANITPIRPFFAPPSRHESVVEAPIYARQPEPPSEMPYARQPVQQHDPSTYSRYSYDEAASHQGQPVVQDRNGLSYGQSGNMPPGYRPPHSYNSHPDDQMAYASQPPPPGYHYEQREQGGYRDPREPPMQAQGRSYEHGFEDRRAGGYSESPTLSRPQWQQPQAAPGQAAPEPPLSVTPSQTAGYGVPPPASRTPFSQQASVESLPSLRPSRGRLMGEAPDESMMDPAMRSDSVEQERMRQKSTPMDPAMRQDSMPTDPAMRQEPMRQEPMPMDPAMRQEPMRHEPMRPFRQEPNRQEHQGSFNTFYSSSNPTQLRGFYDNFPPPPPPQQGYQGSPPGYGPSSGSPTFGTMMMHSGPEQGQGIFRHHTRNSSSGPSPVGAPGSAAAAAAQNSKYRQLQPAPIPPHRNWSAKPELKTIPYDHKDTDGQTAQLPSSGPTTIRGWQVNPQSRRAQQAQRIRHLNNAIAKNDYSKDQTHHDRADSR